MTKEQAIGLALVVVVVPLFFWVQATFGMAAAVVFVFLPLAVIRIAGKLNNTFAKNR